MTSWIAVRPPSGNPSIKSYTTDPTDSVWYPYEQPMDVLSAFWQCGADCPLLSLLRRRQRASTPHWLRVSILTIGSSRGAPAVGRIRETAGVPLCNFFLTDFRIAAVLA